ncbi:MAG: hypothetical protein UW85_C0007G0022 [Parcubacteria group bacterium GW2011_GWA1_Parcubacteria_45_10]|nr:MAG: hypothetical protein UW85_C0007G0022 [Parcubacteria group bacterium GW2011_GWA1_Parcubacteria_45_10]
MAEINEYFPSARIRTMQSDLKSLTETGGSVPIEKEIKIAKEDYLFQEQKQAAEIKPPELEISSAPQAPEAVLPPQKIGSVEMFRAPSQVEFSQAAVIVEDKINPRLIIGLGAGLVLILGLSVGFWMIYPKITQPPVAVSPSQTPLPTAQPTPSPSPEAPSIILKIQAQKFPLALAALDADELSQKLKVEMLLPEATSTLISFEPKLAGGNEYLPGSDRQTRRHGNRQINRQKLGNGEHGRVFSGDFPAADSGKAESGKFQRCYNQRDSGKNHCHQPANICLRFH